jgi:ribulose kinase
VALGLGLTTWALVERLGAVQARAERDRALDQVAVVSAAAKACSVGVDEAKKVGKAAIDAHQGASGCSRAHLGARRAHF